MRTLKLYEFVARQYWRKHWATRYRFRAHSVENGAFESGASRSLRINYHHLQILINCETVARAPGCPQKTVIVQFGSEPLSQEGNTMFGPGEYRPDPSVGITAPADLPQPQLVPYSRNDLQI